MSESVWLFGSQWQASMFKMQQTIPRQRSMVLSTVAMMFHHGHSVNFTTIQQVLPLYSKLPTKQNENDWNHYMAFGIPF
jgi:hypothetical protein